MSTAPAFDQYLRRFRADAGLTQERLAQLSDLSIEAVKTLESGRRRHPRPATVEQLAAALDLAAEDRDRLVEAARRPKAGDTPASGVPRQVPPPITDFTGRADHLDSLATLLAGADGMFDVLTGPDAEVRRSLSLSLDRLASSDRRDDADAAVAFPVLALFDGDHFPLRVAAAVLDRSLDDTEDLLERLVDVSLLESPAIHTYRMHDLVREIGRAVASTRMPEQDRREARLRELACYASVPWRHNELTGGPEQYGSRSQHWSAGAEDLTDLTQVIGWLEAELPNLRRLVRRAAEDGEERLVAVQMALGMPALAVS